MKNRNAALIDILRAYPCYMIQASICCTMAPVNKSYKNMVITYLITNQYKSMPELKTTAHRRWTREKLLTQYVYCFSVDALMTGVTEHGVSTSLINHNCTSDVPTSSYVTRSPTVTSLASRKMRPTLMESTFHRSETVNKWVVIFL